MYSNIEILKEPGDQAKQLAVALILVKTFLAFGELLRATCMRAFCYVYFWLIMLLAVLNLVDGSLKDKVIKFFLC